MNKNLCQYILLDTERYVCDFESGELKKVLVDVSSSGKERNLPLKKQNADYLSKVYEYISKNTVNDLFLDYVSNKAAFQKRSNKVSECSSYLEFAHLKDLTKHLSYIESCHSSLCPVCNYFRSRRDLSQLIDVFNEFFNNPVYQSCQFLFLTLTVPSCYGSDLQLLLDKMNKAFNKMLLYPEMKIFLGGSRSLEITHNCREDSKYYNTYHPHFHILLISPPTYGKKEYISQKEFIYLWNRALGVHKFRKFEKFEKWYDSLFRIDGSLNRDLAPDELVTQIDIRKVKFPKDKNKDSKIAFIIKVLLEVLKYPFKESEFLTGDIIFDSESVFFLDGAMYHRRRWNLFGCLRDIKHELHIEDETDQSDLVQIAGLNIEDIEYFSSWWWSGTYQEYLEGRSKSISEKNMTRKKLGLPALIERD